MADSVVCRIEAGVLIDPIDAAMSWRTARRAAAALTRFGEPQSEMPAGSIVLAIVEKWVTVSLRTGWIARHVVHREVDLDNVRDWMSMLPGRVPVDAAVLLGEAAHSSHRAGRVAAAVTLREWASLPQTCHGMRPLTSLLARQMLTLTRSPSVESSTWFSAAYLSVPLEGCRETTQHLWRLPAASTRALVSPPAQLSTPRLNVR
jgi:hypothetical protein|tara:strand:- start:1526 stop:2137 length:612 start_codon:yes stop_codon:yes gene_type:complete